MTAVPGDVVALITGGAADGSNPGPARQMVTTERGRVSPRSPRGTA
jgi:hypothetical protein